MRWLLNLSFLVVPSVSWGSLKGWADLLFRSVLGLLTAIRAPPPPRVAHSTPLGLLYLGTHALFCRAAGSVVAPGFAVPPRPSGACSEGVCTRLGGFPVPRRKMHRRVPSPSGLKKIPPGTSKPGAILALQERRRDPAELGRRVKSRAVDEIGARRARQSTAHGQRGSGVAQAATYVRGIRSRRCCSRWRSAVHFRFPSCVQGGQGASGGV